jgi:hypothetical protein
MRILAALDGRLGAAPQMRSTGQGEPWATFSVAVSVSAFGDEAGAAVPVSAA